MAANRKVGDRFQIKNYPTIKFLRQGKMTTFHGNGKRDKESFMKFVRNAFSEESEIETVPDDFTAIQLLHRRIVKQYDFACKRLDKAMRDISKVTYFC